MDAAVRALCAAAIRPYLTVGRFPYHYAQSKLRFDAVFLTLLRRGLIPDGARVIDLGCGQSLLASVLLAARRQFETDAWPQAWPAPPANLLLHGIEPIEGRTAFANVLLHARIGARGCRDRGY
jgi:hypothetical protein